MPSLNTSLQNFASGELSPKMRGRVDLAVYFNGLEKMENFICETQGAARFRTGTKFVHNTKNNNPAALYPFQFNDQQSYILEFTDGNIRIYTNEAVLVEAPTVITGATNANPVVITSIAHGYNNGDEIFINQVTGMTELNGKSYIVANATLDTYELTDIDGNNIDGTGFGTYISGGVAERIVDIVSPYLEEELFQIKFAQDADVMYIVHPNYEPRKFTRTAATVFTLLTFVRIGDPFTGPGDFPAAVTFYESRIVYAATNNQPQTLFFSATPDDDGIPGYDDLKTGTNPEDSFRATLALTQGNRIRWIMGTNRFLSIGTYAAEFKATGAREEEAITPSNINIRPLSYLGVADIIPASNEQVIIFTQRGKRTLRAFQFDISTDSYIPIDKNLIADHITLGFIKQITFQSERPNVLWAVKENGDMIGLTFEQKEDVSGWHRHTTRKGDTFESCSTMPQDDGFEQLWVVNKRSINGVERFYVEFMTDQVDFEEPFEFFTDDKAADTNKFLNKMFEDQKKYIYCDSALTFDGTLTGIAAGATVTPAATTGTPITFTASAPVFSADMVGRQIWKKTLDGTEEGRGVIIAFTSTTSVDCNIVKDFDSVGTMAAGDWYLTSDSITGLEHLEGELIAVIGDGGELPQQTVSGGAVTLPCQVSKAHFGLQYLGFMKTMSLEIPTQTGPGQTKPKNMHQLGIRFFNTLGASFGTSLYELEEIGFRKSSDYTNRPPSLFSGDKVVKYPDSWNIDKAVFIEQKSPLPCTVQMLVPYFTIENPFTGV